MYAPPPRPLEVENLRPREEENPQPQEDENPSPRQEDNLGPQEEDPRLNRGRRHRPYRRGRRGLGRGGTNIFNICSAYFY